MGPNTKKVRFTDISHVEKYLLDKYLVEPALNLGSGFGRVERRYKIDSAIDKYSDEAKKYANHFYKHDLSIVPYPVNKKFKTIICFGTAYYLKNPEVLIKESYRLLEKGGYLLINLTWPYTANHWAEYYNYPIRHCGITVEQYKKHIKEAGFKLVKTIHNYWFNLRRPQWLWRIIKKKRKYFICLKE